LNVDIEHTEGLGSLDGVADEEAALFSQAHCAIVPLSEKLLTARVPAGMRTVTFGTETAVDLRLVARKVIAPGRQQIRLSLAPWMVEMALPRHLEATLNLLGEPIAENAAAAVAAAVTAWSRPLGRDQIVALSQALGSVRS